MGLQQDNDSLELNFGARIGGHRPDDADPAVRTVGVIASGGLILRTTRYQGQDPHPIG